MILIDNTYAFFEEDFRIVRMDVEAAISRRKHRDIDTTLEDTWEYVLGGWQIPLRISYKEVPQDAIPAVVGDRCVAQIHLVAKWDEFTPEYQNLFQDFFSLYTTLEQAYALVMNALVDRLSTPSSDDEIAPLFQSSEENVLRQFTKIDQYMDPEEEQTYAAMSQALKGR